MFKRLVIAVAFAALTVLIGTGSDAAANTGSKAWLTDGTIQGNAWQGLPDNLNRSAKFVVLDGFRNNGLGAVGDAGQRTTLTLTFDRAPEDNCVRVALFDPNSIGRWDQYVDGQLVRKAPDVLYEIFQPITLVNGAPVCTEDLLLDGNANNDPAPLQVTSAYKDYNTSPLNNNDDIWVDLFDKTTAQAEADGLKLDDGRFRLVFRATLLPAPVGIAYGQNHDPLTVQRDVSSFTGRERSAYKIAFDGTYLVPAGGTLGFAGGIIDERVSCNGPNGEGCGSTRDDMDGTTGASDPVTMVDKSDTFAQKESVATKYWYDGVFNFHIHSTHACEGDIDFKDADADWVDVANLTANDFDANGFLTGAALTGIPPENVGRYIRPNNNTCGGQRDIGQTKIPGGAVLGTCADRDRLVEFDGSADQSINAEGVVNWNIFPIGGYVGHNTAPVNPASPVTYSSRDSAFCGRASYTVDVEVNNANNADCPSGGSPFKTNTLDQTTIQADPGLWCLQWRGLDCANFVFMQFNVPVGTTPRPKLKIDVFCDIDKDCERGQNDTAIPLNGGVANLTLTEVDCNTEQPIVGGVDIKIATDANGVWTSPSCPALPVGCYKIDWDGPAPLPGGAQCLQLPTVVSLGADSSSNQCVEVQIPLDCTGTISGDLFCKESTAGCTYDSNADVPLPAGTKIRVIATRTTPNGPESTEVEFTATGANTSYMIEGLEFDTYTVSYAYISAPAYALAPPCTATRQVTLSAQEASANNVDFGFVCTPGQICGDVYCEDGTNCLYDAQTDMPLPAGTKYVVTLTPVVNGVPQPGDAQTFSGTAPATRYCFESLELGTYEITVSDDPASTPAEKLPKLVTACLDKKTVVLTQQTPEVDDCDFGYDCTGKICGDVYCENTGDCLYDDAVSDKPLPVGTVVVLTLKNGAGATVDTKTITAPATAFCFEDLAYDTYTLSYAFDVGSVTWDLSGNCEPSKEIPVNVTDPTIDDCDFGFECVGDICGDVYCEDGRDCTYDPQTDKPLPTGTKYIVILNKIEGQTQTEVARQPFTAPATRYCFEDQPLGTYEVSVVEDPTTPASLPLPSLATSCASPKTAVLSAQQQNVDDCDFGYICTVSICGDVYCEETGDCKYDDQSADGPLPSGSVVDVVLTPIVGGQPDLANQQTRRVTAPATRYCFDDLAFGTYEITYAWQPGSTELDLADNNCDEVKTETLDASTGSIDDCDFGFVCDADITGRVFCDVNLNGSYESPPDLPPTSATIQAQRIPTSGPLPAALTTAMGIGGTFAFNDIPPGTYVLKVIAIDPDSWTPLFDNVNGIEVTVPAGEEREVLFPYDCRLGEIHGTVYCDDDLSGSLTLGDLRFADVEVTATGPGGAVLTDDTNAQGEYEFTDLVPGTWTITVSTAQLPWSGPAPVPTAPLPVEYVIDVARGDRIMDKDFVSLCLGRIYGYVFQDPLGDCDGVYQENGDEEVDGARIRLTGPAILPGGPVRETQTNAAGFYEFTGLPRGIYKVEILDPLLQKWVDLGLALNEAATPREVPGINLPRLGEERVDFGFCIQKLEGYVFQDDPAQDCDGVYQQGTDIPVDGATIRLTGPAGLPAPNPRTTTTDANGYYSFPDLVPGDYTVEILSPLPGKWEAINLTLVEAVTPRVQNANLPLGETERRDFGHCTQSLGGRVFKQPYGNWDDIWNPAIDTGLGDILIRLRGTSGDALGYDETTRTLAPAFPGDPDQGTYSFEDIPTGEYEVTIVNGDAVTNQTLSVLIGDRDRTYTPDVMVGDRIPDLDFPFCECEQQLCVNVFREQVDVCNNEYDENVDELLEFIEVRFEQLSTGRNTILRTDADGRVCLPILEPGDYKVSVAPRQPGLEDCRPSLGSSLERVVSFDPAECEDQELWFGFCCCTKQGCCEGKLSEVVMETRFWMCDPRYTAKARMFMDCGGDDLVDVAEASLVDGDFSSVPGAEGVISIESITHRGPLVTVRVRIKATGTRFPGHNFGNAKHLVTVTLNGETNKICEVFRAEVMRPGAIPGCRVWDEKLCRWVKVEWPCEPGVSYREVDWDRYECGNLCWKFGIVEICCWRDWCRCNCDCPETECEPCRGYVTKLALRYDGDREVNCVITQSDDGRLLFDGAIKPGDVLSLVGKGDDGSMGTEIKIATNKICVPIATKCHELLRIGTSKGGFTIVGGESSDGGPFCDPTQDVNGRPIDPKCRECCIPERPCDCIAGVTHLAFKYVGLKAKWAVILQDFDGRYLFEGMVRPGDIIRVRARGDDGTMGTTIKLLTNEFCGELDVTCAEPIGIGTQSGPFLVVGGASRDGGRFCGSPKCKECPDRPKEEEPCPTCPK